MTTIRTDTPEVLHTLRTVVNGSDLEEERAYDTACAIMEGHATPSQIAALLIGLRMKGEAVPEITGFARALRDRVEPVPVDGDSVVDTCGTGGDGHGTFNVSTVCAFVAAGARVRVAKHGNRSVSSRCGSAEVLDRLGLDIEVGPRRAAREIDEVGLSFLFAPRYHCATRHAVIPRREIGVRSIFNLVGPLTNPAGATRQLLGVFDGRWTEPLATVLGRLGSRHCLVVHGEDGLDEITLSGRTRISELRDGEVHTWQLDPASLGFRRRSLDDVRGGDPETNATILLSVLEGHPGPARELVLINAGAVIYAADHAHTLAEGVEAARESIDSGRAFGKLAALRSRTGTPDG